MKAFPRGTSSVHEGMDLRDYFAAKAMQALITAMWDRHGSDVNTIADRDGHIKLHVRAYEHADLMLEARDAK